MGIFIPFFIFLPIKNDNLKFLTLEDIENYNSKGFVSSFKGFDEKETINLRNKVDNLFDKLK